MARRPEKLPRARILPASGKRPRTAPRGNPTLHDSETIVWAFGIADPEGLWGWRTAAARIWWTDILPKLRDFESMTWAEIIRAAGGRTRGNNSHFVDVRNLTGQAKARLVEIGQDDVSALFSLRLSSTERIYGIRDRRALKLLWFDPHHGTNARVVYPVRQR